MQKDQIVFAKILTKKIAPEVALLTWTNSDVAELVLFVGPRTGVSSELRGLAGARAFPVAPAAGGGAQAQG